VWVLGFGYDFKELGKGEGISVDLVYLCKNGENGCMVACLGVTDMCDPKVLIGKHCE
jgi:hypothetical protein